MRIEEENNKLKAENKQLRNNIELMTKYNNENLEDMIKLKREYDILDGIIELNNIKIAELKEELEKEKQIYKENVHYLACMTNQRNKLKFALEEIREILCEGRTFNDGYFDNQNLSRTDKAIKVINEVLKKQQ